MLVLFLVLGDTVMSKTKILAFRVSIVENRASCQEYVDDSYPGPHPQMSQLHVVFYSSVVCLLGISPLNCELFLPFHLNAHLSNDKCHLLGRQCIDEVFLHFNSLKNIKWKLELKNLSDYKKDEIIFPDFTVLNA